jgi:hypothetical protein
MLDIPETLIIALTLLLAVLLSRHWLVYYRPSRKNRITDK